MHSGSSQLLADFGHRTENCLRQFLDDMELADVMGKVAKHLGNGLRIQRRTVGRDAPRRQFALLECRLERAEETLHVCVGRIVVQHLVGDAPEGAVVDNREDTERAVV